MIKSFADKRTEQLYNRIQVRKLPHYIQHRAVRKLWMIDAANRLNDLKVPPSNHLEKLSGNLDGYYSIRINKQWRICFQWKDGHAYAVGITDYH